MLDVLYLAERGSTAFEVARHHIEVVCVGDSLTGWNNHRRQERDWSYRTYPEFLQGLCEPLGLAVADCGIAGEIGPKGIGQVRDCLDLDEWPDVEVTSPGIIESLDLMVGAARSCGRSAILLGVLNPD